MSFLHIAIIIVCVFIIGVLLVNAAFFNHENNGKKGGVSSTTAWAMIFLNLMFIVPLGILLVVSTYELVKGTEAARKVRNAAESIRQGALDTTSAGGVRVTRRVNPGSQTTVKEVSAQPTSQPVPSGDLTVSPPVPVSRPAASRPAASRPAASRPAASRPAASRPASRAGPRAPRSSSPRPHRAN